jgi:hypothetical protein
MLTGVFLSQTDTFFPSAPSLAEKLSAVCAPRIHVRKLFDVLGEPRMSFLASACDKPRAVEVEVSAL